MKGLLFAGLLLLAGATQAADVDIRFTLVGNNTLAEIVPHRSDVVNIVVQAGHFAPSVVALPAGWSNLISGLACTPATPPCAALDSCRGSIILGAWCGCVPWPMEFTGTCLLFPGTEVVLWPASMATAYNLEALTLGAIYTNYRPPCDGGGGGQEFEKAQAALPTWSSIKQLYRY